MPTRTGTANGFPLLVVALLLGMGSALIAAETKGAADVAPASRTVTFESDVQPLLTRLGCNSGACHGKSRGQNGFALSLLGFDSDFDYAALVGEARGRRVFPAAPESSLVLRKAAGQVPHGGGKRLEVGSPHFEILRRWIEAGAPRTPADAPHLVRVTAEPATRSLAPKESFPLRVIAEYSDGSRRDVTDGSRLSVERQNDRRRRRGDGRRDSGRSGSRRSGHHGPLHEPHRRLRRDDSAARQRSRRSLRKTAAQQRHRRPGLEEAQAAGDAPLACGRATRRFTDGRTCARSAACRRPRKRARSWPTAARTSVSGWSIGCSSVPEYADFWANKWADLLRPNPYRAGIKAVWNLDAWLRERLPQNKPYDQFVRELVTAQGSTWRNGATVIFRDRPEPVEIGASVSQLFLGVRLECAKCHHHPFEVWSQDDFYGFAAFFSRVGHKGRAFRRRSPAAKR